MIITTASCISSWNAISAMFHKIVSSIKYHTHRPLQALWVWSDVHLGVQLEWFWRVFMGLVPFVAISTWGRILLLHPRPGRLVNPMKVIHFNIIGNCSPRLEKDLQPLFLIWISSLWAPQTALTFYFSALFEMVLTVMLNDPVACLHPLNNRWNAWRYLWY